MKKALVLLLILAIAGGMVFAQDTIPSIGGRVRTGVAFNFDPAPLGGDQAPLVQLAPDTLGRIDFRWKLNDYTVGFDFLTNPLGFNQHNTSGAPGPARGQFGNNPWQTRVLLFGEYDGDIYGFKAELPILTTRVTDATAGGLAANDPAQDAIIFGAQNPTTLWGWLLLFDDALLLDVAYRNGRDKKLWAVSDLVGGHVGRLHEQTGIRLNFQGVENLNAGLYLQGNNLNFDQAGPDKVMDLLKNIGIGGSYDFGNMAFSLETRLRTPWTNTAGLSVDDVDAEVFLGSKFLFFDELLTLNADLAMVGLGRFGEMGQVHFGIGAKFVTAVDAQPGRLTIGLKLRAWDVMDNRGDQYEMYNMGGDLLGQTRQGGRKISVDPYAEFIISDNLWADVKVGFYVGLGYTSFPDNTATGVNGFGTKNQIAVGFQPRLVYHFLGTAANADPHDPGNGIIFRYNLGYDIGYAGRIIENAFFTGFRWSF